MGFAVAQFVHRYPPAVGGAELYFQRLSEYLAAGGDAVTVWTTTAVELGEFWKRPFVGRGESANPDGSGLRLVGQAVPDSSVRSKSQAQPDLQAQSRSPEPSGFADSPRPTNPAVHRYAPVYFPLRRYLLKAVSLVPYPPVQALTLPCNPVCPNMWRDAGQFNGPLDAVHATAFPYSFPIACALRLARRRDVPFLVTPFLHLGDPSNPHDVTRKQYTQAPLRWLLRQADRVFAQTPGERDAVIRLGVPAERVVLQGLGVEPAECTGGDRAGIRATWGVADDECVVGHLANLSVEKGTVDLLMAAKRTDCRVVLAGPRMPNFQKQWERLRSHQAFPVGVLSDREKRDFFAGIDVFCLPSRTDSFGLVLLEAWANGVPVVVYRAGGPGELVRDGVDGFVTDCDPAALMPPLARLSANPELRRRLGATGRARLAAEFRWADKLGLVRDTIHDLICREPDRRRG